MPRRKKRVRLSFLVARTQQLLFFFLGGFTVLLAAIYLFLMNRLAMQGYILSMETEKHLNLASELGKVESQIARYETREYVSESAQAKVMVQRERQRYLVMKQQLTAQKEEDKRRLSQETF
jgi:hypothetical protein